MRRFLFFVSLVCCCLFLAGCGNTKTLNCSYESNIGETSATSQDFVIKFKNDVVSNISMIFDVALSDVSDESNDSLQSSVDNTFSDYRNLRGVDYSAKVRDNGFTVKIKVNFAKMDKNQKSKIKLINYENNYEQIRKELESNNFICK